jgi:hypothetical protein
VQAVFWKGSHALLCLLLCCLQELEDARAVNMQQRQALAEAQAKHGELTAELQQKETSLATCQVRRPAAATAAAAAAVVERGGLVCLHCMSNATVCLSGWQLLPAATAAAVMFVKAVTMHAQL